MQGQHCRNIEHSTADWLYHFIMGLLSLCGKQCAELDFFVDKINECVCDPAEILAGLLQVHQCELVQ